MSNMTADQIKDEVTSLRLMIHRVGPWAAMRNAAKNGVPIEIALIAHCGALPTRAR